MTFSCSSLLPTMRWRACLTMFWVAAALGVHVLKVEANPVHEPRRLIHGQLVELAPLMKWWTNHSGSRPLAAWPRVTGAIVGTNAWGWVVEAQVERTDRHEEEERNSASGSPSRILLSNPPLAERAEFEKLSAQLKELVHERGQLTGQETEAKGRADAISKEQSASNRKGYRSRQLAQESRQVKLVEGQAATQVKALDQRIQDLKKQLANYPNLDHYELDCFALDTGKQYNGMAIFDYGSWSR